MLKKNSIDPKEIADARKRLIELEKTVNVLEERVKRLEAREEIVSTPVKK